MNYYQPTNINELVQSLKTKTGNTFFAAGCTDFLVQRYGKPWYADGIISLNEVDFLKKIKKKPGCISIGAACTHTQIEENAEIQKIFPALTAACGNIGSKQIRNRGTIGGNLMNASPAADLFPVILALHGNVVLMNSNRGFRKLPADDFVTGSGTTALAADEVLTAVELPRKDHNSISAFGKIGAQYHVTIAKISLSVSLTLTDRKITDSCVVLGAVGEKACISYHASDVLLNHNLHKNLSAAFCDVLMEEVERMIPGRASVRYKKYAVQGLGMDVMDELIKEIPV